MLDKVLNSDRASVFQRFGRILTSNFGHEKALFLIHFLLLVKHMKRQ